MLCEQYDFKYVTEQDHSKILTHLQNNFYLDEPVNRMLGTSKERVFDLHTRYTDMLKRYSKCIYVTPKNKLGVIAGVLIVYIHDRNNPMPEFTPRSPITLNYRLFLQQEEAKYCVFQQYGLTAFPELAILSVDKMFRGKGLATELYRRSIAQLFSEGYPIVYTEFSNPISRKIGQNLGFKEVARFYLNECKTKESTPMFPSAKVEDFVSLMILENNIK